MNSTLFTFVINNHNGHIAAHGDQLTGSIANHITVAQTCGAFKRGLNKRRIHHLSSAAHMERAHGQLCARLTDRLCGNNANSFTVVDRRSACKVTAIACATDAAARFAGQCRADFHHLHTGFFDTLNIALVHQGACFNNDVAGFTVVNIKQGCATKNTLADGSHNLARINNRRHGEAQLCAAITFDHDAILSNVNEAARQITGVSGFQSRVSQTLTGAVG